jgi:DNA mismatch endonuclease, patch repair protein
MGLSSVSDLIGPKPSVRMSRGRPRSAVTCRAAGRKGRYKEGNSEWHVSAERSSLMSRIRQKGTAPELVVRQLLRELAVSYRLNVKTLPGTPDIVLTGQKKAIVVHGCFWHRHEGCRAASAPKTRVEFWAGKFAKNIARDRKARRRLNALGYSVMVVWECQAKRNQERDKMLKRLIRFALPKSINR